MLQFSMTDAYTKSCLFQSDSILQGWKEVMICGTPEPTFSHKIKSNNTAFPGAISASFQQVVHGLLVDGDSTLCFNSHAVFGKGAYRLQRTPRVHSDLSGTKSTWESTKLSRREITSVKTTQHPRFPITHRKRCSPDSTSQFSTVIQRNFTKI